jgi:hypothetical protein
MCKQWCLEKVSDAQDINACFIQAYKQQCAISGIHIAMQYRHVTEVRFKTDKDRKTNYT